MTERLTQVTLVDKDILELLPGEMTCDVKQQYWFIGCPVCKEPGGLARGASGHNVVDRDGIITVSSSLLCKCGAHYFIEANQIRWC